MLNRSVSLAMSTSVLKALPGKLDIKRHSPSILYTYFRPIEISINFVIIVPLTKSYRIDILAEPLKDYSKTCLQRPLKNR